MNNHSPSPLVYQLENKDVLESLKTTDAGLSVSEAKERLVHYGANRLTSKRKVSPWKVFFAQFSNSLTITLIVAALLIMFVWYFGERDSSDLIEASLILAIIVLIAGLGFFQEYKAERAIESLKKMLAFQAKVLRGGKEIQIEVAHLVPGDIVILEEGEKIPADIRLLTVASFQINEAPLTGESAPVSKLATPLSGSLQIADQKNMAFSGTVVTQGRATGVVVATGDATEIGKIAQSVADVEETETPIQKRLDTVGRILGYIVLGIAIVVFIFIMFFAAEFAHQTLLQRVIHSFIAAIALAVAAIPEGLPAVVTISLALGTQRMLKRNALVRKLNSIETLGSTNVICADKTGTLTKGEMTVRELYADGVHYSLTGTGYERMGYFMRDGKKVAPDDLSLLLASGYLCNNAKLTSRSILGDPTEAALLVSSGKSHVAPVAKRLDEVPFSSERKMMSVLVREKGRVRVYSKGAPEVLLSHCTSILKGGKVVALTTADKKKVLEATEDMSQRALRTLGFAYREAESGEKEIEQKLIFIGLQGMIDPPRSEIKSLIRQCADSGIRVIMITGDHAATAKAVAHEVGIPGEVSVGNELDALSPSDFQKVVSQTNIFARVSPSFKMQIVEALKKQGHIVAMTGDGVNDAPALKMSDIGIAMGKTGTDVAKEASDMVLLDDKFSTIIAAIEEGRGVFDNIRKFVNYLLSCNIGEVIVVFVALLIFKEIPFTATMLLWINVITDGLPAVALGMDPAEKGIMRYSPKKFQGEIIPARLWGEMIIFGILLTVGVLGIYWFNLPEGVEEARAAAFMAIVIFELVRLFAIRVEYKTSFFSNGWLLVAAFFSLALQCLLVYVPALARLFDIRGIDWHDWVLIALISLVLWYAFEALRWILNHFYPERLEESPQH
ncbi:MAG TPA: calcium-translocating P-type ATPase, PMCA-type [Patescibacteria group bacterium]